MKYKLKDIFDLQMGKTPSRNNSEYWNTEDYKWISIADLSKNGMYILDTKEYLSEKAILESGIKVIPANTVVMSFKLSIGKTAITAEDMYSNEAIMSFHDKHIVELLPEYIFYMFKYKNWDEDSNKAVMGKTLNKAILSETVIEICSIEKQKEIVNILNKMTCIIEKRQQELSELDTLIKARFVEMFGDIGSNSYKWDKELLGVLCDVRDGTHDSPKYCQNGYPLLTSKNVTTGTIDLTSCSLISEEDYKRINERSRVDVGDIIMPMIGTVGKPIIVDIEPNFAIKNVALIKFKDNTKVTNVYIRTLLQSDYFKNVVFNKARGGTQKFISLGDIRKIDILLPPLSLQNEFATFVQQIDKLRFGGRKRLTKAKNTKNNNRNTITLERSTLYGK